MSTKLPDHSMRAAIPSGTAMAYSSPNPGRHNWFLYLFLFLLPLQNLQTGHMPTLPGGLNFLNIGFLLAFIGAWRAHGHLAKWSGLQRWTWAYLAYCYFALVIGFYMVPAPDAPQRFNALKDSTIGILLFFVVQMSVTDWNSMKRVLLAMLLPMPYILRVTWSQHASVAGYAYKDDLRIHGTFSLLGANEFASFCTTMALVFFAVLIATKLSKVWRALLIMGITCMVLGVLWAYSRTSYVTILLGAAVILLLWRGRMKLAVPALLALLIVPPLLPHSVTERFDSTHVDGKQVDESTDMRYVFWGVAWKEFTQHPLTGIGYGTFSTANPYGMDAHNFFVRELAEKGLPGFIITIGLFLSMAKVCWRTFRDSPPGSFAYALGLGMCGAWPALVVTNIWGDRFTYTVMIGYYWVLLGLCLKAREFAVAERTAAAIPTVAVAPSPPRYALPARLRKQTPSGSNAT
jgi:putative inorganic carbon (HCO3(-)) transporter